MAKIRISKRELSRLVETKDLILSLNMLGFPTEEANETELEVEVFPNRPDTLSLHGLARALNAFLGKNTGIKKYNVASSKYQVKIDKSVETIRPYTVCAVITNVGLDNEKIKEIIDLQEKLHNTLGRKRKKCAIGIYPIEKITFPVTYKALPPKEISFRPLGSGKIQTAQHILDRHPTGKEYAPLLRNLNKYPVFVDAKGKVLSMPPVINSEDVGRVEITTKDIFIECSGWHKRTLDKTLAILCTTFAEMGGKINQVKLEGYYNEITPNLSTESKKIDLEEANDILGLKIKSTEVEKLLKKMQYEYVKGRVIIPAWRSDILHQIDIIEDLAIAYGYENITPELPKISTIASESRESILKNKIIDTLVGLGYIETSSYHFITQKESDMTASKTLILESTKTDYKRLRHNLTIPLLRTLSQNTHAEYPQNLIEIGSVFTPDNESATGIAEKEKLGVVLAPGNFTSIKQTLDYLFRSLGLIYEIKESSIELLIDGRTASVHFHGKNIGCIGEVHPKVLHDLGIKMPVSVLELSLQEIYDKI